MADEYISREAAINQFEYSSSAIPEKWAQIRIEEIPAADVVPVVHGWWVLKRNQVTIDSFWIRWECSECGYCRAKGWEHSSDGKKPRAKLCEMCGALMDKDGDGDV